MFQCNKLECHDLIFANMESSKCMVIFNDLFNISRGLV